MVGFELVVEGSMLFWHVGQDTKYNSPALCMYRGIKHGLLDRKQDYIRERWDFVNDQIQIDQFQINKNNKNKIKKRLFKKHPGKTKDIVCC